MCGRYTVARTPEDLRDYFDADIDPDAAGAMSLPTYNASPGQALPVITGEAPRSIRTAVWGFRRDTAGPAARFLINARSETVAVRPTFRDSFLHRRCLVLADGFYEWQRLEKGKRPYRLVLASRDPFAFAGIWEPAASGGRRFVILTTEANALTAPIHERMPVILDRRDHARWLEVGDAADVSGLLGPFPGDRMEAYAVSPAVNSPKNDSAELIQPATGTGDGDRGVRPAPGLFD